MGAAMTDQELMQQALDALEKHVLEYETAEALRARLAQPEPKPVAWQDTAKPSELVAAEDWENIDPQWHWMYRPLYTAPPQREWQGLTNDEVNNFAAGCHLGKSVQGAIYEAAAMLKEKNR